MEEVDKGCLMIKMGGQICSSGTGPPNKWLLNAFVSVCLLWLQQQQQQQQRPFNGL